MADNLFGNLGPVGVTWFDVTGGTDLGKTEGDAVIRMTEESADIKNDQDGTGPVDSVITGFVLEVATPLSDITVTELEKLLGNATLTPVTGQDGTLAVSAAVGRGMYANSAKLELTRYVDGSESTDQDDLFRIHHAYPVIDAELVYGKDTQRVVNVTWKCFPSRTTGQVGEYFQIGPTT